MKREILPFFLKDSRAVLGKLFSPGGKLPGLNIAHFIPLP